MAIENYSKREINLKELYTGEALCREVGDLPFFPDNDDTMGLFYAAKRVCLSCVLKVKCQNYAIQNKVTGIWGGTSAEERRKFRLKNGIVAKEVA